VNIYRIVFKSAYTVRYLINLVIQDQGLGLESTQVQILKVLVLVVISTLEAVFGSRPIRLRPDSYTQVLSLN